VSALEVVSILLAGLAAGTINTIVGSGTLITFPTLLFFGIPPVSANVSNTVGLVFGGITGVHGYRRELAGSQEALRRLMPMSFLGAVVGALLLLILPESAFSAIVPVLILLGVVLVIAGPRLQALAATRHTDRAVPWHQWAMMAGVFFAGIYGGYFGAAQGVLLMGVMTALSAEPLQRLNGYKNVLGTVVNAVAAVTFMLVAWGSIRWAVAALIGVGAFAGGIVGSTVGRRLPPLALRGVIVVIGVVAILKILVLD
jgi:uncharacterized membrane protein YfcA